MILKLEALIIIALPALLLDIDEFETAHGFPPFSLSYLVEGQEPCEQTCCVKSFFVFRMYNLMQRSSFTVI